MAHYLVRRHPTPEASAVRRQSRESPQRVELVCRVCEGAHRRSVLTFVTPATGRSMSPRSIARHNVGLPVAGARGEGFVHIDLSQDEALALRDLLRSKVRELDTEINRTDSL